jgi:hypothetical protein
MSKIGETLGREEVKSWRIVVFPLMEEIDENEAANVFELLDSQ